MNILLTGGSGLLGQEILRLMPEIDAPTRKQLDLTEAKPLYLETIPDLVVHAAAYTSVNQAELEQELCYATNVTGTKRLASIGCPMLYVSTDSVFDGAMGKYAEDDVPYPKNFYSLTKLLGEQHVRNGIIVRCCPKTRPWAHEVACTDRWFSAEYVDQTAAKIVRIIKMMVQQDRLPKILHIGGARRTHFEMAQETRADVKGIEIPEYTVYRGRDLSLDTSLWESLQ